MRLVRDSGTASELRKTQVSWVVRARELLNSYRRFGETWYIHMHDNGVKTRRNIPEGSNFQPILPHLLPTISPQDTLALRGTWMCSQQTFIRPCPEPDESTLRPVHCLILSLYLTLGLSGGLFSPKVTLRPYSQSTAPTNQPHSNIHV
jgi:hypothetical protein